MVGVTLGGRLDRLMSDMRLGRATEGGRQQCFSPNNGYDCSYIAIPLTTRPRRRQIVRN